MSAGAPSSSREDSQPTAPVEVLFVGGMPRSGSTLLDLMLGQLPSHCDVGELFYMWSGGALRNQRCACGEPFDQCPFWAKVGEAAFGGWDTAVAEEVIALQHRVDRTARLPHLWLRRFLPSHRAAVERYLELTRRVYRAVQQVSGADIVVDSTKRPSTAYLLASDPQVTMRVVHIVRDPRGVLNSWSKEVPLPEGAGVRTHLKARPMRQVVRRWLTVNLMISLLARRGVPLLRIRYEDLVVAPREAMQAVLALSDRTDAGGALDFISAEGIETGQSHAATGGRVRFSSGPMVLRPDEKWRTALPPSRQRLTKLLCGPLMRRYGYR